MQYWDVDITNQYTTSHIGRRGDHTKISFGIELRKKSGLNFPGLSMTEFKKKQVVWALIRHKLSKCSLSSVVLCGWDKGIVKYMDMWYNWFSETRG